MMYQIKSRSIEELQKIKKIINIIIGLLEDNIKFMEDGQPNTLNDSQRELLYFLIGNKESEVSIITKLSNLLLKFNTLEDAKEEDNKYSQIDDIDLEIIKTYIEEQNKKAEQK